ncbi:hypothetical protein F0919_17810 [Taibaiella lutea]|uniref:Uncharacterized protein n=1 Tax=Taibaiella lutea TaxID=2608001 RepID=A0A5M6CBQ9_9BACT|nr:hypothetical protein [Taibaiella lutea]KAA5532638.1 hypothetical protein F0919_17810 [Taibaiella lutea]
MMTIAKLNEAIRLSLQQENYYSALALALTMPDICGKMEFPKLGSEARSKNWFDKYMRKNYECEIMEKHVVFMTAGDCYALRCSFLHEAKDDIEHQRASDTLKRFQFTTLGIHRIKTDEILNLNVSNFCLEICAAVDEWIDGVSSDNEIMERTNLLLTIKDSTYSPIPFVTIGNK